MPALAVSGYAGECSACRADAGIGSARRSAWSTSGRRVRTDEGTPASEFGQRRDRVDKVCQVPSARDPVTEPAEQVHFSSRTTCAV